MPTYFGMQTRTADDNMAGQNFLWTGVTFSCPGSGTQNIQELSVNCFASAGSGQKIRAGVYNSAGTSLIAEGTAAVSIPNGALAWQGHMTQAAVKAAGGVSPGQLVGGTSYLLAHWMDGGTDYVWHGGETTGTQDQVVASVDYSAGLPATFPGGNVGTGWRYGIRCGVDPAVLPSGIAPAYFNQFPKPLLRTPIEQGRLI